MLNLNKDYQKITKKLVGWISDRITEAGCDGAVIGLSGGIDSSVTSVLSKQAVPENTLGVILPCYSSEEDISDAKMLAEKFNIEYQIVNLDTVFDEMLNALSTEHDSKKLAVANIKPRLRMTALYYYATKRNSLVVGTDNKSELKTGYFTKYGDGGIDIAPLGNLVKNEVKEVAKVLEIPEKIINRKPSAGLWTGQSDESEMGITYNQLDKYILTGEATDEVKKRADELIEKNTHKLKTPPIPKF